MDILELISVEDLKNTVTYLNKNIDDNLLSYHLTQAHHVDLQEVLGSDLYNSLITKVSGGTLTGTYATLAYDYCVFYVITKTLKRTIPYLYAKFNNASISTYTTENSNPIEMGMLNYFTKDIDNDLEKYEKRLIKYMNDTNFTERQSISDTAQEHGLYRNINSLGGISLI